jgi:hypothetical protein
MPRVLPEFRLSAAPVDDAAAEAMGFRWADAEVGQRHKIGGVPDPSHSNEAPTCTSCESAMSFYGQLDSIGDGLVLADCGLVQVFVCFDCFTASAFVQSG